MICILQVAAVEFVLERRDQQVSPQTTETERIGGSSTTDLSVERFVDYRYNFPLMAHTATPLASNYVYVNEEPEYHFGSSTN